MRRYKFLVLMFTFAIVACGNINGSTHKTDEESSEMTEKQTKPEKEGYQCGYRKMEKRRFNSI